MNTMGAAGHGLEELVLEGSPRQMRPTRLAEALTWRVLLCRETVDARISRGRIRITLLLNEFDSSLQKSLKNSKRMVSTVVASRTTRDTGRIECRRSFIEHGWKRSYASRWACSPGKRANPIDVQEPSNYAHVNYINGAMRASEVSADPLLPVTAGAREVNWCIVTERYLTEQGEVRAKLSAHLGP